MVGRQAELAAIERRLRDGVHVALTGAPGIGKSLLARKVLQDRAAAQDRCAWVCLAGCSTTEHVLAAISAASPADLRAPSVGRSLLVLDEADGALDAVGRLSMQWRVSHPNVDLLLTSRSRWAMHDVQWLQVPSLCAADALELLVQRVRATRPSFLEGVPRSVLAGIVEALERCPADIVAVAKGAVVLTAAQMAKSLEGSAPPILSADEVDEVVHWPALPICGAERQFLACCALFPAGFTLDAVEQVNQPALPTPVMLRRLLRHSLLIFEPGSGGGLPRYRVPRLVALAASSHGVVRPAEIQRFIAWAVQLVSTATGSAPTRARRRLVPDLGNLKAAFRLASRDHPSQAATIALAVWPLAVDSVRWPGAPDALHKLSTHRDLPEQERIRVLLAAGVLLKRCGRDVQAGEVLKEALQRANTLADVGQTPPQRPDVPLTRCGAGSSRTLQGLDESCARAALRRGDWLLANGSRQEAAAVTVLGLAHARRSGLRSLEGALLMSQGLNRAAAGRYGTAIEDLRSASEIYHAIGRSERADVAGLFAAEVLGVMGRCTEARSLVEQTMSSEISALGKAWQVLGTLNQQCGEWQTADLYLRKAKTEYERLEVPSRIAALQSALALLSAETGRLEDAERLAKSTVRIASDLGIRKLSASAWYTLAQVQLWRRDFAAAEHSASEARWRSAQYYPAISARSTLLWAMCAATAGPSELHARLSLVQAPPAGEDPVLDRMIRAARRASPQALRELSNTASPTARLMTTLLEQAHEHDEPSPVRGAHTAAPPELCCCAETGTTAFAKARSGEACGSEALAKLGPSARSVVEAVLAFAVGDVVPVDRLVNVAQGSEGTWRDRALWVLGDVEIVHGHRAAPALIHRVICGDLGSALSRREMAFWTWAHSPQRDPCALASWANDQEAAPVRHRRARALLGLAVELDQVDRRVVSAVSRRLTWVCGKLNGQDERTIYVVDTTRMELGCPSGERFLFATTPVQWALLLGLIRARGAASKEELASAVWDDEEYHPMVHDNRLRVGIFKLRRMLRSAQVDHPIVATVPGGYSLNWTVRITHQRQSATPGVWSPE